MANVFEIDDVDKNIIRIIQIEPNLTHTEIAKRVNRSQPTVGMRIKRLEEKGVIKFVAGININSENLQEDFFFAKIELQTKDPEGLIRLIRRCPFMLNAFKTSGNQNFSVILTGFSISEIEEIVNSRFRADPDITDVRMELITGVVNDLVLPLNLDFDCCMGCQGGTKCNAYPECKCK